MTTQLPVGVQVERELDADNDDFGLVSVTEYEPTRPKGQLSVEDEGLEEVVIAFKAQFDEELWNDLSYTDTLYAAAKFAAAYAATKENRARLEERLTWLKVLRDNDLLNDKGLVALSGLDAQLQQPNQLKEEE